MSKRRERRCSARGPAAIASLVGAVLIAASSEVAAQAEPDTPADDPRAATPPSVPPAEEPSPTEFPGVVEGGVVSASAAAPPSKFERPWPTQRRLALSVTEGSYNGFGLGFRAGSLRAGVETAL